MKHKHADVIKAWADNQETKIQWRCETFGGSGAWKDCDGISLWDETNEYRVKPEPPAKSYPSHGLSHGDLCSHYYNGSPVKTPTEEILGWNRIANAALRHAVDAGQVITTGDHQAGLDQLAHNLRDAAINREKMRDLAIALAVQSVCITKVGAVAERRAVLDIDLTSIVKSIG